MASEKIIFSKEESAGLDDIYMMNPDGSNQVQLTNLPGYEGSPKISPDGTKIAFISDASGMNEVYVMNVDGTNIRQLTSGAKAYIQLAWHPSGTKLYYDGGLQPYDGAIHSVNIDGTGDTEVINHAGYHDVEMDISPDGNYLVYIYEQCCWTPSRSIRLHNLSDGSDIELLPDDGYSDFNPRFSPDGNYIIWQRHRSTDPNAFGHDIWRMNKDGLSPVNLTGAYSSLAFGYASYSRDGNKIVSAGYQNGGDANIYVMNTDGSGLQQLTSETTGEWYPDFGVIDIESANRIVYSSNESGNYEIWKMDGNGGNKVQLTNSAANETQPKWSRDGQKIVYTTWDESGNYDIWAMNSDGSGNTRLTNTAQDLNPTWTPDGTKVLFFSYRNGGSDVYIMDADGANQTRLTTVNGKTGSSGIGISPDGASIAYTSQPSGYNWAYYNELYSAALTCSGNASTCAISGATKIASFDGEVDAAPSFTPDGKILWSSGRNNPYGQCATNCYFSTYEIYRINPDGTGEVKITSNTVTYDYQPVSSPDGSKIIFSSDRASGSANTSNTTDLWIVNSDGTGLTQLTDTPAYSEGGADWWAAGNFTTGAELFSDDFSTDLTKWTLFGSPRPQWLATAKGRSGIFDNNGDPNYSSGAVSNILVGQADGFTIQSDVYLDFSNLSGCWAGAVIGLTKVANPSFGDTGQNEEYGLYLSLGAVGDACWGAPVDQRRHSYLDMFILAEDGTPEGPSSINADSYANGWHTLKIQVSADRSVSFFIDNNLLWVSTKKLDPLLLTGRNVVLGWRSSGSAGKAYHDSVTVIGNMANYTLTVTKSGAGSGTIVGSPTGISCGIDCSEVYASGTAVTLTAAPDSGSTFTGWGGACAVSGTDATCTLTMDSNKNATAEFVISDTTTPTITSATSTNLDGVYSPGTEINITLNFSEAVSTTGLTITLNSGASIMTGPLSGVATWSGTYTVGEGQTSSDLSITSITGTITDGASLSTVDPTIPPGQNIGDAKAIVIESSGQTSIIGDINGDGSLNLADAILGLRVMAGIDSSGQTINLEASLNGGAKIGLPEVLYILQIAAELRTGEELGINTSVIPAGKMIDFSTGTVGTTGDISYWTSGSSLAWTRSEFSDSGISSNFSDSFFNYLQSLSFLPPSMNWWHTVTIYELSNSFHAREMTQWVKTTEGKYAIIFVVDADESSLTIKWAYPYGNFTWENDPIGPLPDGSLSGSVPTGSSFDFSTGTVDLSGQSGDFRYQSSNLIGLIAPSGVSWWTGGDLGSFENLIGNPNYLPPPQGYWASGYVGNGTRWLKTAEGRYAMIFSVNATSDGYEFFYVYPYGSYTWSDHEKPLPPVLQSVSSGSSSGSLQVAWQRSSSDDVTGYWVYYGTNQYSSTDVHAGDTDQFTLEGLTPGQLYYIWVVAYDHEGNRSDFSTSQTGTPQ